MSRLKRLLPPGSRQRIAAGRLKSKLLGQKSAAELNYSNWIEKLEPLTLSPAAKNKKMKISVVVPCFNTPRRYLDDLIGSLLNQTYGNWQLCLADGSNDQKLSEYISQSAQRDNRIVYKRLEDNLGISDNTNQALSLADGDWIAFLDHDDVLPVWALNEVAAAANASPKTDIFYSDEDRLSEDGTQRLSPLFKPDWSPDLFLCANYVAHFFVIHRRLLDKLGGLRSQYDGSQDYDLMLRALDYKPQIHHIPKILYHMRMAKTSTASSITTKSYAHTAGQRAVANALKRQGIRADVLDIPDRPTNHRIKYQPQGTPLVSIIIPFKDKVELLAQCVQSVKDKTKYANYELILISNNSQAPETRQYLKSVEAENIRHFEYNQPFNFSAICNFGRRQAKGDVLVFMNNDTVVITSDWLEELAANARRPEIGAVGPLLLYPDDTIQHAGVIVGYGGTAGHIFRGLKLSTLTPFWLPDWPRNYLAVTAACVAVEAKKFDAVSGFDEDFVLAGGDVVLCLDLYEAGYRNLYWPYARLHHHESKSHSGYHTAPASDYRNSLKRYRPYLNYHDPYFNPNLDLNSEIPKLRSSYD